MGKRKDSLQELSVRDGSPESVNSPSSSHKKHKKHKKKHKRQRTEEEAGSSSKGSIKLKLKIGTETLGTKNVVTVTSETTDSIVNVTDDNWDEDERDPTIKTKKPGDETSDEEKEWLTALEKGELDDYGEVNRRKKDPSLMTARQRALKHGTQAELLQLPTGYKQVELTEEQLKRREQRAHKRKQMAQEKREKDKRQTLDRLLKKQESKLKGAMKGRSFRKCDAPKVTYINNSTGISISTPVGVEFPFAMQKAKPVMSTRPKCAVSGCGNDKKYACSKTGIPLCSLECYKKNLTVHKLSQPGLVTT